MKQYLIDTFRFNDWANRRMIAAIQQLAEKSEVIAIFSHIIRAQDRWLLRAKGDSAEAQIKWWDTPFDLEELGARWEASLKGWFEYLTEVEDIDGPVRYTPGPDDNGDLQILRDIVLQLNYHSILHRAEIGLRVRDQGFEPPHVDYIYYLLPQNQAFLSAGQNG